ncbi:MAG TPA: response regulator [Thermoanaerobaculia bacterium]|nr:response regulator [Thermoanaerobaculia bacterium]
MPDILLVDDDQLIAESLRQFLLRKDWNVDSARTAGAARDFMKSKQYRVVVLDPFLTGSRNEDRELLMINARHLQPNAALIILTAYSSAGMARVAADCRVSALLSKPQPVVLLSEIIASVSQGPVQS